MEEADGRRKGMRRVGEGEVERLQEREKGLEMVERLDTEIWAYRDQCEDCQLLRLKKEKMKLEKKLSKMKQPVALPGQLGLQAAHLGRDGLGLLLQPLITSSGSPFLASSLLLVKQGGAKNTSVRFSKRQSPEQPINNNIFCQKFQD